MFDTGFFVEPENFKRGGGGLVSTTLDYARLLQMLLNGGELDGARILGRNTVESMTTDHLGSIPKTGPILRYGKSTRMEKRRTRDLRTKGAPKPVKTITQVSVTPNFPKTLSSSSV